MGLINKKIAFAFLIILLVFSRLIPHPPNFTPIISIVGFLSGVFVYISFILTIIIFLSSMLISDFIIGFYHWIIIFTYITLFNNWNIILFLSLIKLIILKI